jgi:hypothetical protein
MAESPPASCPSSWLPTKEQVFNGGVIAGQLIVMILLVIFAFMKQDTSFICRKPREFLGEAIVVGVGLAISVFFIGFRRGNSIARIGSASFIGFLVFFIFHFLMEFSGENKKKSNFSQKAIFWPLIITSIILTFIAFLISKFDMCASEAILEAAIFGLFNTIPIVWIEYNRGDKAGEITLSFFKNFFLFGSACFVLQAGGFWSNVFPLTDSLRAKYTACDNGVRMYTDSEMTIGEAIGLPKGNSVGEATGVPNFKQPSSGSLLKSLSGSAEPVTGSLLGKLKGNGGGGGGGGSLFKKLSR